MYTQKDLEMKVYKIDEKWLENYYHTISCDDYSYGVCRNVATHSMYKNGNLYNKARDTRVGMVCEEHLSHLGQTWKENIWGGKNNE